MPSLLWCFVVGIWTGLEAANLPPRPTARLELLLQSLVIATTTLTSAGLLVVGIATFARYHALTLALTGLSQAVIRAVVIVIGGLVLLGHLGITITPILTALGIGGLAVAFALQDTLSNLSQDFTFWRTGPSPLEMWSGLKTGWREWWRILDGAPRGYANRARTLS